MLSIDYSINIFFFLRRPLCVLDFYFYCAEAVFIVAVAAVLTYEYISRFIDWFFLYIFYMAIGDFSLLIFIILALLFSWERKITAWANKNGMDGRK